MVFIANQRTGIRTIPANSDMNALFALDEWVHVAVTFNSSTDTARIFLNGLETPTQPGTNGQPEEIIYDPNATAHIGGIGNNSDFDGEIDEMVIWSTVLTDQQIDDIYQTQRLLFNN